MKGRLGALRPARGAVASLVRPARAAVTGAARRYVRGDLREGVIRISDLPRLTRSVVWLGFALLFAMVGALLLGPTLRGAFPLVPLASSTAGRGELVPTVLLPLTLFIVSVAWGFILAGALHARPAIRRAALVLYLVLGGFWAIGSTSGFLISLIGWGALLGVPVFFFVRRKATPAPAREFAVLVVLISLTFGPAQAGAIETWRETGLPTLLANLPSILFALDFLIMPLLLFIGLDIAEFVYRSSGWAVGLTDAWTNRRVLYGALFLLLAWRLVSVSLDTLDRLSRSTLAQEAAAYAGALMVPLSVGAVWWLVGRPGGDRVAPEGLVNDAKRAALPLVAAYVGLQLFNVFLVLLAGSAGLFFLLLGFGELDALNAALEFSSQLVAQDANWQTLLAALALLAAAWFARRGRRVLALYLGIVGSNGLWIQLTNPGRPLDALGWSGLEPVDFWWVVLFSGFTLYWLSRGRLTEERVLRLVPLVLVTFLMRQTDFIEDPFSPFLGFTGVGLIAFGIVWDSLRAGFWANNDSPGLPRVSRIFLYLGYVLFSVAVINWAVASHDILAVDFYTGEAALGGFGLFGKPLIYALFAVTLAWPTTTEAAEGGSKDEPPENSEPERPGPRTPAGAPKDATGPA
jgi:hypothetical protein